MHIEVLVEDSSGAKLLETLLPNLIGSHGEIRGEYTPTKASVGFP